MTSSMRTFAELARAASQTLARCSTTDKDRALEELANTLLANREMLCKANEEDIHRARGDGIDDTLQKRLSIQGDKFDTLVQGVRVVKALPDPVGKVLMARELDHDLDLLRVACPIGVLCIIFESRPEAAVQIACLAIKSGNAVMLKGGKEAQSSNEALVTLMRNVLATVGLPQNAIQLVSTRQEISELLKMNDCIDLIIPRGSNALVSNIMKNTTIPVMGHADGICSIYVGEFATDVKMAVDVVVDSKTTYPAACNSAEVLLVHHHQLTSPTFMEVVKGLISKNVTLMMDDACTQAVTGMKMSGHEKLLVHAPSNYDFFQEHLSLKMSVCAVESINAAIDLINRHSSHHTDVIITTNDAEAATFLTAVDSAGVYHNASSRFADGFRYGFGAEVGVSTNRLHARGPVGLDGLSTYKYLLKGRGQVTAGYGTTGKKYTHEDHHEMVGMNWGEAFQSHMWHGGDNKKRTRMMGE